MRNTEFATVTICNEDTTRRFYILEAGDKWKLGFELGSNYGLHGRKKP